MRGAMLRSYTQRIELLYDKICEILIISNYQEKFPLTGKETAKEMEMLKQNAIEYYLGRWDEKHPRHYIDFERTRFHARIQRDCHLIMAAVESVLEEPSEESNQLTKAIAQVALDSGARVEE